ncbi:hypothetical protein [Paenibacillus sp. J2TS4]|uniref:hypothetical protein n=1 Tax=Paenibacillus sp. J2TS4 TaxID=2807194 RepID=UPI001B2F176F|nr:hypothetical protein [Paenibacillus sp. J2TS4]GIP32740.1 hypothetical protein J2TS4_19500 [Paenibacillus sp. J2TS4]
MGPILDKAFKEMLGHWNQMSASAPEQAEADAERFQHSFYELIDLIRDWIEGMKRRPRTLDEALKLPEIARMIESLPAPLYLNMETELELIVEGQSRVEDAFDN